MPYKNDKLKKKQANPTASQMFKNQEFNLCKSHVLCKSHLSSGLYNVKVSFFTPEMGKWAWFLLILFFLNGIGQMN